MISRERKLDILIENFRCFHKPFPVEFRPVNILVGENSTGKSSFLAATRFLFDVFNRRSKSSFNKDPFYLGSFEDISHNHGRKIGRAPTFSFAIAGILPPRKSSDRRAIFTENAYDLTKETPFKLTITCTNRRSQPHLSTFYFKSGEYNIEFTTGESPKSKINTPSIKNYLYEESIFLANSENNNVDISYIQFLTQRLSMRKEWQNDSSSKELVTLSALLSDVSELLPVNVYASAPVRSRPERTYNPTDTSQLADGGHIPFVLAQLSYFEVDKWADIRNSLAAFGKASGLFHNVTVKKVGSSTGGPFQIMVKMGKNTSNLIDVGYGVSQVLPLISDVLRAERNTLFLFQQPEVHLHPKAQAELGTFFSQMSKSKNHKFIIETHSDYLIDRIRTESRDRKYITNKDVGVLYFKKTDREAQIHQISVDKSGNFINAPKGYRDFFLREEMRSLGLDLSDVLDN